MLWFSRRGWQMSCPFHSVPPYLWSFPLSLWSSLSPCLFLIYSSSTIIFSSLLASLPPSLCLCSSTDHGVQAPRTNPQKGTEMLQLHAAMQHMTIGLVLYDVCSLSADEKRRSVFIRSRRELNMWSLPPVKTENFSLLSGPSNCVLLLSSWRRRNTGMRLCSLVLEV